ncbi:MAG: aspartate kinase [Myxococcales bacterium]|nr:aspartate kinase [Myxococcales bacterium]
MSLVVQKFGGTSLADADKIHRAARRAIRAKLDGRRVVLVVSAMGKATDELLSLANDICADPSRRELDMLLTTGEQVSIALMAMAINAAGHEAISLTAAQLGLVTDSAHTRARIQRISRERIDRELRSAKIVIVAGFQGIDSSGEITTMGRGASDTTAAALASVLGAEVCEIYTDVDGIYSSDPRIVPEARKIDTISYDVMLEMAGSGAGVMHSRAVEFGKKFNVPIHVRSSLTDSAGTMTAIVTGVKTRSGVLSVGESVQRGDHEATRGQILTTIVEQAEQRGLSTGVVTTTPVTHATPGACYAHSPERKWQNDALLTPEARSAGFPDIARQLIEFSHGDGLEVVLGGGRMHFLPVTTPDPEHPERSGARLDGRDLTAEWVAGRPRATYVWNRQQLDAAGETEP